MVLPPKKKLPVRLAKVKADPDSLIIDGKRRSTSVFASTSKNSTSGRRSPKLPIKQLPIRKSTGGAASGSGTGRDHAKRSHHAAPKKVHVKPEPSDAEKEEHTDNEEDPDQDEMESTHGASDVASVDTAPTPTATRRRSTRLLSTSDEQTVSSRASSRAQLVEPHVEEPETTNDNEVEREAESTIHTPTKVRTDVVATAAAAAAAAAAQKLAQMMNLRLKPPAQSEHPETSAQSNTTTEQAEQTVEDALNEPDEERMEVDNTEEVAKEDDDDDVIPSDAVEDQPSDDNMTEPHIAMPPSPSKPALEPPVTEQQATASSSKESFYSVDSRAPTGESDKESDTEARLKEQIRKLEEQIQELMEERQNLPAGDLDHANEIAKLRSRVENLESTNQILRTTSIAKSKEAVHLNSRISELQAENDELRQGGSGAPRASYSGTSAQKLSKENDSLKREIERLQDEMEELHQKLEVKEEENPSVEAKTRHLRAEIKRLKADVEAECKASAQSAKAAEAAHKRSEHFRARVKELQTTNATQREHIEVLQERVVQQSQIIHSRVRVLRNHVCLGCATEDGEQRSPPAEPQPAFASRNDEQRTGPRVAYPTPGAVRPMPMQRPAGDMRPPPRRSELSTQHAVMMAMLGESPLRPSSKSSAEARRYSVPDSGSSGARPHWSAENPTGAPQPKRIRPESEQARQLTEMPSGIQPEASDDDEIVLVSENHPQSEKSASNGAVAQQQSIAQNVAAVARQLVAQSQMVGNVRISTQPSMLRPYSAPRFSSSGSAMVANDRAQPANPMYHRGGSNITVTVRREGSTSGSPATTAAIPRMQMQKPSPGTRYVPGSTNGTSPSVASRPAQTESLAVNLTQQCREIISKLVLVNRKYGLEFTDVHETLMRRHPEQATLIAAIVQAAKGAIGENGTGAQQAVPSS